MNCLKNKIYYYAKVTIEAKTALFIASGKNGFFSDNELVRDFNGLPGIAGTTITGIIRHLISLEDKNLAKSIFGYADSNTGVRSNFECSWGLLHDSNNKYHKTLISKENIKNDSIFNALYGKTDIDFIRDHNRINERGSVEKTGNEKSGKFDRMFVPAGARFTFDVGLWSEQKDENAWQKILACFYNPSFRIGGAGRSGYGCISVVEIKSPENQYYDISNVDDLENFKNESSLKIFSNNFNHNLGCREITLSFPLGFRIGGGSTQFITGRKADIHPYSERVIEWENGKGSFTEEPQITIPGSSVKGAIWHRTAFHLARINMNKNLIGSESELNISKLFGDSTSQNENSKGKAGKIWFSDIRLNETKTYQQTRNSIDRYTGGTRASALFQEENAIQKEKLSMKIYYEKSLENTLEFKAFCWALDDLEKGRLSIGGGSGHGLGFSI